MLSKKRFKEVVFIILGASSTCSCVALVFGGRVLSLYTISLILSFILIYKEKKNKVVLSRQKLPLYYIVLTLIGTISCLFGALFFMGETEWVNAALSGIPKIWIYYFLFYGLMKCRSGKEYCCLILKGLLLGVIINSAWATVDAFVFYTSGYSMTNEIFRSYIIATDARYESLSLILGPIIRSAGLNADPANIGMFAPILASYSLYSKRYWLIVLSFLAVLASVSIVALASVMIVALYYMVTHKKAMGIGIVIVTLTMFVGVSFISLDSDNVSSQMINAVTERLEEKSESDKTDKDNARAMYWLNFVPAVVEQPTVLVIGTGYNTASFSYLKGGYVNGSGPYDPEQNYFSVLFNIGLWGFLVFLSLHINILKNSYRYRDNRDNLILYAGMEGIMTSFMGYHYTLYSVSTLFLISGIVLLTYEKNIVNEKSINNNSNL